MNWSLGFEPLLSWPWLVAILVPLALLALAGLLLGQRGALFRIAALAALVLALVNPVLLDEQRDPLKSVVALIADRSQSQDIGNRNAETSEAIETLRARLARYPQYEVRVIDAGRADAAADMTETRLFGALESAFRDVPPSRIGGAVMVTTVRCTTSRLPSQGCRPRCTCSSREKTTNAIGGSATSPHPGSASSTSRWK